MVKKPIKPGPEEDWALWQSVAKSAKPLPGKQLKKPQPPHEPPLEKAQKKIAPKETDQAAVMPQKTVPNVRSELPALNVGTFTGLDKRTAQRLRRGQLKIEGRLDLHHCTQAEAQQALIHFIADSVAAEKRTVIVITGKGLKRTGEIGILRTMVPRWLNLAPIRAQILAVCEATPQDGGSGALYLRLKKFS